MPTCCSTTTAPRSLVRAVSVMLLTMPRTGSSGPVRLTSCPSASRGQSPPGAESGVVNEDALVSAVRAAEPDLLVSWFWTKKLPASVLAIPRLGTLGVHPSLLPRHRGPDPTYWAIRSGDAITGVTAHRLEAEKAGIEASVIEALLAERAPDGLSPDDALVVRVALELNHLRSVSDATYADALARFGPRKLVELTSLVGYYTMVAMALNAHEIPLPEGAMPAFALPQREAV